MPTYDENVILRGADGRIKILLFLGAGSFFQFQGLDEGDILLLTDDEKQRILLQPSEGNIWLGGNGKDGDLMLFPSDASGAALNDPKHATIHLDGNNAAISLSTFEYSVSGEIYLDWIHLDAGGGKSSIRLRHVDPTDEIKSTPVDRIVLDAEQGNIWLGGNGKDGDLVIFDANGDNKSVDKATIHLDGKAGDIVLNNADCAEEFDVSDPEKIEPGTVMVLDGEGKLQPSTQAYDKKVTGVVSGAGEYKPGIVLDRKRSQNDRVPVALVGKVYCKVDAQYSAIEVGDLLTTSPTPGHAMKASDPLKAFGAVIGKAMRTLETGQGLIPMLIALQ